jgi:hypothetical protein
MNNKDIMNKWGTILNSMGVTGSKATWMNEYMELQSKNEYKTEDKTVNDNFFFPVAIQAAARTIAMDLVSVQPMYPNPIYKKDIRCKKIKSILERIKA